MKLRKFDKNVRDELAETIRALECECSAELVVAVRARSGSYRRADFLFAAVLSFVTLLFVIFSPFTFGPEWILLDVVVMYGLGVYLSTKSSAIRRLFTPEKQRAAAVRTHAAAMFYEAGIANTEAETGVLVYLSLMERRLELIADRGILRAVPPMDWNGAMAELHRVGRSPNPDEFIAGLKRMGAVLAQCLPPDAENPNELSDTPYFDV